MKSSHYPPVQTVRNNMLSSSYLPIQTTENNMSAANLYIASNMSRSQGNSSIFSTEPTLDASVLSYDNN